MVPWVHKGLGILNRFDTWGARITLILLLWGPLGVHWGPLGAPWVHQGQGIINKTNTLGAKITPI